MEKQIKDYIHLYLGCKAEICHAGACIIDNITPSTITMSRDGITQIKPVLRRMSSLTDTEESEMKLSIQIAMDDYYTTSAQISNWFFKNGFDCFQLIQSGLAIDKTTIK